MWLPVIGILLVAAFLTVWLGFVPPPGAAILIKIRNGSLDVRRGTLRLHARDCVAEILRDASVSHGFIAITSSNRVMFSRQIPGELRQRLRNVLLNQWA